MIEEINQLVKDYLNDGSFDARNISRRRLSWIHYLIKMGERIGVPPQDTIKSMPHTFGPGCDVNLAKFPEWMTEMDKTTTRSSLCCSMCNSLPYIMKECQNCGYIYCWSCFKYLANLYVLHKKINRPDKPTLCPFVCVNDTCWLCEDLSPPMITNPSQDRIHLINQIIYVCNQVDCSFEAKGQDMINHVKYHQNRNETNFRIPDESLPLIYRSLDVINHQSDEDVKILCPPSEIEVTDESCVKVEDEDVIELSEDDDDDSIVSMEDESGIQEDITSHEMMIDHSIQQCIIKNIDTNGKTEILSKIDRLRGFYGKNTITEGTIIPIQSSGDTIWPAIKREQLASHSAETSDLKMGMKLRMGNSDIFQVTPQNITRRKSKETTDLNRAIAKSVVQGNIGQSCKAVKNLKNLGNLAGSRDKVRNQVIKRTKIHIQMVKKFCPPLYIEREDTPAWSMVMNSVELIRKNKLKVISLDIVGQTLLIGDHYFGVPGSYGMMTTNGVASCDLIRWARHLLLDPYNENILTGLKFDYIKYCRNITISRIRVMEFLSDADIIVLHGLTSVLQKLGFTRNNYNLIRHKIRDIGAYYNCHKQYSTLSLQLATYLIFGMPIHGLKRHYAIHNAYFILCLYLADRERIEKTYEKAKSNVERENGWPVVHYPLNSQICGLLRRHMEVFGDWPQEIKESSFGQKVFKHQWNQYVEPAKDLHPPYTNPRNLYERFFPSFSERISKRPRIQ